MAISDLSPQVISLFRDVAKDHDSFVLAVQFLNVGGENEKIRWISRTPDTDYTDIEKLKSMKFGKVTKAGTLYEFDTGKIFVVEVNEAVFEVLSMNEKRAFAFWVLSHINISFNKNGEVKCGVVSPYTASKELNKAFGSEALPSPELIAGRFGNSNNDTPIYGDEHYGGDTYGS